MLCPLCNSPLVAYFCIGHGFKLSPVIGKILSELALDKPLSYNLSPFKLSRFKS